MRAKAAGRAANGIASTIMAGRAGWLWPRPSQNSQAAARRKPATAAQGRLAPSPPLTIGRTRRQHQATVSIPATGAVAKRARSRGDTCSGTAVPLTAPAQASAHWLNVPWLNQAATNAPAAASPAVKWAGSETRLRTSRSVPSSPVPAR
ncbi:hypothetical protein [Geminicoccus flavidas]|uniref:hypothetical protein n=1 Tax=Geminicoccus flavidas TaxID=2506407 RepID=UPI00135C0607|nr:hypothetical protein [Geminicoccus flavidas]